MSAAETAVILLRTGGFDYGAGLNRAELRPTSKIPQTISFPVMVDVVVEDAGIVGGQGDGVCVNNSQWAFISNLLPRLTLPKTKSRQTE